MSLSDFIHTEFVSVHKDTPISEVIQTFEKNNIRWVPVVDGDKNFLGAFSTHLLIKSLMPNVLTVEDSGIDHANFILNTKDKLKGNLKKILKEPVENYMDAEYPSLRENEADLEALLMMYKYGSPLPVLKADSKQIIGFVSHQTAIRKISSLIK